MKKVRLEILKDIKILKSSFRKSNKTFEFIAGSNETNNRLVCEAGFLIILGLSNNSNASSAPQQWRLTKKWILESKDDDEDNVYSYAALTNKVSLKKEIKALKFEHARTFIHNYAISYGDIIADENGFIIIICCSNWNK